MPALTLWLLCAADVPSWGYSSLAYGTCDVQLGQPVRLCPPPPHIVGPEVLASVQERAEVVARQLGLSGYACLEGFMNADTGSLTVMEVTALPPLDSSSTFLTQVTVLPSPDVNFRVLMLLDVLCSGEYICSECLSWRCRLSLRMHLYSLATWCAR